MSLVTTQEAVDYLGGSLTAADTTLLGIVKPMAEKLVKDFVGYNIEQATWTEYYPLKANQVPREPLIEGWEVIGDRAIAYGRDIGANRVVPLKQVPVRSITTIHENEAAWDTAGGSFTSSDLLTDGTDYQLDLSELIQSTSVQVSWTGHVIRRSGSWSQTPRAIRVVYVAGLSSAELTTDYPEFRYAALLSIAKAFNEAKAAQGYASGEGGVGPVTSERLADWAVTYAESGVTALTGMTMSLPDAAKRVLEPRMNYNRWLGGAA